tara:strand:+ start:17 stop:385 length:369 start_codon:yes stop_codon:yes gene_type:complete
MAFILQHWKLIAGIAYTIAIPVYFSIKSDNAVKNMESALDTSQQSNQKQIKVLQDAVKDQREAYDKMFKDYQDKIKKLEEDYQKDLKQVKDKQAKQQKDLQERFADPKVVDKELEERFGLKK